MAFEVLAGRVKVLLNSDARDFTRGGRQARADARRTQREMRNLRRSFARSADAALRFARRLTLIVAPITALAGSAGFARLANNVSATALSLRDLTERTRLSAEALQGYELLLGGTNFELRNLGNLFTRVAERVNELRLGSQTAIDLFGQLGLTQDALTRAGDIESQLQLITEAYQRLANIQPGQAAGILQTLLGGESELLQQLVSRFGTNITGARRTAFQQTGGLTNRQVDELAELRETFLSIGDLITVGTRRIIAENALALRGLADRIENAIPRITNQISEGIAKALEGVNQNLLNIEAIFSGIFEWMTSDLVGFLQRIIDVLQSLFFIAVFGLLVSAINQLSRLFDGVIIAINNFGNSIGTAREVFAGQRRLSSVTDAAIRAGEFGGATRFTPRLLLNLFLQSFSGILRTAFIGSLIGGFIFLFSDFLGALFRSLTGGVVSVAELFSGFTKSVNDSLDAVEGAEGALTPLADAVQETVEAVDEAGVVIVAFSSEVAKAAKSISDAFGDAADSLAFENRISALSDQEQERERVLASALGDLDDTEDKLINTLNKLDEDIIGLIDEVINLQNRLIAFPSQLAQPINQQVPPFEEGGGPIRAQEGGLDRLNRLADTILDFFTIPDTAAEVVSDLVAPFKFFSDTIIDGVLAPFIQIGEVIGQLYDTVVDVITLFSDLLIGRAVAQEQPQTLPSSVPFDALDTADIVSELEGVNDKLEQLLNQQDQAAADLRGTGRLRRIVSQEIEPDPTRGGEVELDNSIREFDAELERKYRLLRIQRLLSLELDRTTDTIDFEREVDGFLRGVGEDLAARSLDIAVSNANSVNRFIVLTQDSLNGIVRGQRMELEAALEDAQRTLDFAQRAQLQGLPGSGQEVIEATENLRSAETALADFNSRVDEGLPLWNQSIRRFADWAKELDLADRFEQLGEAIESNLERAIENVILEGQSLTDAFKGFVQEIISEILRIAVIRPLAQAIGGAISAGFGAAFGAPTFARGGLAGRGFAVIGEVGPELVDFSQPGRVYSNEQLGRALQGGRGGGIGSLTMNIQSSDGPGVRAAINESLPAIVAASTGEVYQAANDRNSDFAQTIRNRASE